MVETSSYLRDLTPKQIKDLQIRNSAHMKRSRGGFLSKEVKEKLLRLKKWEKYTTDDNVYSLFSDMREHTKTAIGDFQLLCDTLSEKELQRIFGEQDKITGQYPITQLLKSLIPYPILFGSKAKDEMKKIGEKQQWRKYILEDVSIESLLWYFHSGIFKTELEKNLIFDMIDAIQARGTGKIRYSKIIERDGITGIAKF